MIPLTYWIGVAFLGFVASVGSASVGIGTWQWLTENRAELLRDYLPEMIRDVLLVVGLAINLLVGITAAVNYGRAPQQAPVLLQSIVTLGLLGGATVLSAFACMNFWLRVRGRLRKAR